MWSFETWIMTISGRLLIIYDDAVNYYMIGQSPWLKIVKFSNHKFSMKNNRDSRDYSNSFKYRN